MDAFHKLITQLLLTFDISVSYLSSVSRLCIGIKFYLIALNEVEIYLIVYYDVLTTVQFNCSYDEGYSHHCNLRYS